LSKRALVTGAAGFIGSALCKHLVASGWRVFGYDALTYAAHPASLEPEASGADLTLRVADLLDTGALADAFAVFRPDAVFHLAAETHVDRSIDGPNAFVSTNVVGTLNLLNAATDYWRSLPRPARSHFRFLHISTDEVFGALGKTGRFSEQSPYDPRSPYAASKAASDHMVRAFHHTHGLPVLISNCCNNYGPRQFPEKLIPLMILKAIHGEPMPVYGTGKQVRDWLHVSDHARALEAIATRGAVGSTYLVGAREERENIEVVRAIAAAIDAHRPGPAPHDRLITHVDDRPGHDFRYAVDPSRIEAELSWSPQIPFQKGISDTVDWYLANQSWWSDILDGSYRGERLGLRHAT